MYADQKWEETRQNPGLWWPQPLGSIKKGMNLRPVLPPRKAVLPGRPAVLMQVLNEQSAVFMQDM